jgi:hypothetical protein
VASEGEIKQRFSRLEAWLDERGRRLWAAAESAAHGRGGISLVARASGVSRRAIAVGLAELPKKPERSQRRRLPIRRKGGGRKKASLQDPDLLLDLEKLLEPVTGGDPQSPLRWTCQSVRNLADELRAQGHEVSHMLVAELLHEQKYSLQANRKTKEGSSHPDRNAQFAYINAKATEFLKSGQPAISVDTKKKEQVGDYKNGGREWPSADLDGEVSVALSQPSCMGPSHRAPGWGTLVVADHSLGELLPCDNSCQPQPCPRITCGRACSHKRYASLSPPRTM